MARAEQQEALLTTDEAPVPLLPQFLGVFTKAERGYKEDEARVGRGIRRFDHFGLLIVAGIYMAFLYAILPRYVEGASLAPSEVPFWVLCAQVFASLVTIYVVYLDAVSPTPLSSMTQLYACLQGPLGRYIFLTRQTMALQFVHQSVSVVLQLQGSRLLLGTDVLAPVVAGAGAFVTIQFFMLVLPNEMFGDDCKMWKARGFDLKVIASALHVPQLPIAIVDLCVLRKRGVLRSVMPSLVHVVSVFFIYALLYVVVLHWNHGRTGHWPYGILEPLGKDVKKWTQFTIVQGCILAVFGAGLWELAHVMPVLW